MTLPRRKDSTLSISASGARHLSTGQAESICYVKTRLDSTGTLPSDSVNADQKGGEQRVGFKHLVFDVPKLEPALESLLADGIQPDPITDISKHIPGGRVIFFRDPEGNLFEFLEALSRRGVSHVYPFRRCAPLAWGREESLKWHLDISGERKQTRMLPRAPQVGWGSGLGESIASRRLIGPYGRSIGIVPCE